jgi:hypothetical protein
MSGLRCLTIGATAALLLGFAVVPAAADPDHPHCTTVSILTRADIPSGYSIRALQEGLIYPTWCRSHQAV